MDTVITSVLSIMKAAWDFREEVKSAGEQVQRSMRVHQQITVSLENTQIQLKTMPKTAANKPYLAQIHNVAQEMESDAREVKEILQKWNQVSWATFRSQRIGKLIAKSSFTWTGKTDALEALVDELSRQNALIALELQRMIDNTPDATGPKINIIFVDDVNRGRSIAAQACAQLLRSQTKAARRPWNINKINSAGLYIDNKGELLNFQESLKFKIQPGKLSPFHTAVACVFDNKMTFPDKDAIHERFKNKKSRGLSLDTFSIYDYIFVFVPQHKRDLERLILEIRKKHGTTIVPAGKANVVLLGSFGNFKDPMIFGPKKEDTEEKTRANWNKGYSKIRLSFQGWLIKTQGWSKPPAKTS